MMNPAELRLQCDTFFSGERPLSAADEFAAMAQWCAGHDVAHDTYGEGTLIQNFEQKIADLLGYQRGLFFITGTMTQPTALRIACDERDSRLVALHPTSHIMLHERSNYQLLEHFKTLAVGDPHRPWTVDDLQAWPDRIGAALYELPMREIGGQSPSWDQLEAIKAYCRERQIHLHMDGARLWEAAAWYRRSHREIAAGFDSAYVSFYKGIGGLGGAMLLGSEDFIARARVWMQRQGGNVFRRSPYVVAAAMRFDARLAAMPAYFARTEWLYEVLRDFPQLQLNPARPQANMLHVHVPVGRERLTAIRDELARDHRIWLFGSARHAALPDHSQFECYVGEALLAMPDERVREILALLVRKVSAEN